MKKRTKQGHALLAAMRGGCGRCGRRGFGWRIGLRVTVRERFPRRKFRGWDKRKGGEVGHEDSCSAWGRFATPQAFSKAHCGFDESGWLGGA